MNVTPSLGLTLCTRCTPEVITKCVLGFGIHHLLKVVAYFEGYNTSARGVNALLQRGLVFLWCREGVRTFVGDVCGYRPPHNSRQEQNGGRRKQTKSAQSCACDEAKELIGLVSAVWG